MIPISDDNPAHRPPVVTTTIIVLCVLVFLWQVSLGEQGQQLAVYRFGMIPASLVGVAQLDPRLGPVPPGLTLFTSMFLHGGWGHLLGNMLYLWIFGNNVEDRLGPFRYVGFYALAGLAAAFAQVIPEPGSTVPMIGASGAISGVLGAYLYLFPHARVLVFIPISFFFFHHIKAGWLLGFWFGMQLLAAVTGPASEAGVAWWAHIGGFVAGIVMVLPLKRTPERRRGPWG